MLAIGGAGMAGLVAAARARDLGGSAVVYEKGDRAGGSMLLSSGFVWRYRSLELYEEQCPAADPELRRAIVERLDDALRWLESLGAPAAERVTGNPLTTGLRFDPQRLTAVLAGAAGEIRFGTPLPADVPAPVILATGGFAAAYARERGLQLRATPWSEGDGLRLARERGAAPTAGLDEFYGRAMPDVAVAEDDFVRLAQVYGRFATVVDECGRSIARHPAAWFLLDEAALRERVRDWTVRELVEAAREAGGTVVAGRELPFANDAAVAVRVRAAVTHTIGGVLVDAGARALDGEGRPVAGLFVAGADAGGWSTGGYASGLAAALVLGCAAAESALA